MTTSSIYDIVKYTDDVIRNENGITLSPTFITMETILFGDINLEGIVDINDSDLIMKSIANPDEYKLNAKQVAAADVYQRGDGITAIDALTIQEYINDEICHF